MRDCSACIVYLIRYSPQLASWKERKPLPKALKVICAAASAEAAVAELGRFQARPYGERLSAMVHNWRWRWEEEIPTATTQSHFASFDQ